jgi:hypothetical protein
MTTRDIDTIVFFRMEHSQFDAEKIVEYFKQVRDADPTEETELLYARFQDIARHAAATPHFEDSISRISVEAIGNLYALRRAYFGQMDWCKNQIRAIQHHPSVQRLVNDYYSCVHADLYRGPQ